MNFALVGSAFFTVVAFIGGYQVAEGRAAKRQVAAQAAYEKAYQAKELEYANATTLLEAALASSRTASQATQRKAAAIGNRAIYLRDCVDDDGLQYANDALRSPTP